MTKEKHTYEPAIHFRDVCFEVDGRMILHNVTGSFPKGKITTLAGPSGAGKSTLLKLCNGLITPTAGDILIEGTPIGSIPPVHLRRKVGIALQDAPMIKGSVFDNLELPRKLAGEKLTEDEAASMLEDVGLDSTFLHQDSKDLSGGQRQKVSIARTLANRPGILLLDEITASLDPLSAKEIENLIEKINRKHDVTIIWITHQIAQAQAVGQYTWILTDGTVAETGESSLLASPMTEAGRRFIEGGGR